MGVRREGREAAVQFLYLQDLGGNASRGDYYEMRRVSPSAKRFCDELLDGVSAQAEVIDATIRRLAKNYEFHRISAVDRNILRVAVYEMLYCQDVPPVVSINEAIEIAKKFSTAESGRFVNGILDALKEELHRPARAPSPTTS